MLKVYLLHNSNNLTEAMIPLNKKIIPLPFFFKNHYIFIRNLQIRLLVKYKMFLLLNYTALNIKKQRVT